MSELALLCKRLSPAAIIPVRGSLEAAGFDLAAAEPAIVAPRGKCLIKTDIAIAVPFGYYGRVAPRSGLALKKGIDTGAGVIDSDYRGNVGVILFNHSDDEFVVNPGDRIAQLIIEQISMCPIEEVEELPNTARGAGGFGSTGVSNQIVDSVLPEAKRLRTLPPVSQAKAAVLELLSTLEEVPAFAQERGFDLPTFKIQIKEKLMGGDENIVAAAIALAATNDVQDFLFNASLALTRP